jgi:protein-disulfide isomerase
MPVVNDKNRGGLSGFRCRLGFLGAVVVAFAPPASSNGQGHLHGAGVALQQTTSGQAPRSNGSDPDSEAGVLKGIPGLDFSSLSSSAQRELASVFTDEFCYCGCPHTLAACLKTHPTCKHARRMAVLAASDAASGVPSVEIILRLSKYYSSFREPRLTLKVDENMCTGKKEAKVTLVEFSDFGCPHCAAARPILEKFAQANAATLRFCFAPFPLGNNPYSVPAAQAALFARDHRKFWEMHDLLFENQARLNTEQIKGLASKIGLSASELSKAIDSNKYAEELAGWKEAGNRAGLDATPTLYINGRKHRLAISADALQRSLEDEIEWMSNKNGWTAD